MALAGMPELVQLYNEGQLRLLRALPLARTPAPVSTHNALILTQKQQRFTLQVSGTLSTFVLIFVSGPVLSCGAPRVPGIYGFCLPIVIGVFARVCFSRSIQCLGNLDILPGSMGDEWALLHNAVMLREEWE